VNYGPSKPSQRDDYEFALPSILEVGTEKCWPIPQPEPIEMAKKSGVAYFIARFTTRFEESLFEGGLSVTVHENEFSSCR